MRPNDMVLPLCMILECLLKPWQGDTQQPGCRRRWTCAFLPLFNGEQDQVECMPRSCHCNVEDGKGILDDFHESTGPTLSADRREVHDDRLVEQGDNPCGRCRRALPVQVEGIGDS